MLKEKRAQYFHPPSGINHSGPRPDIRPEGMWGQNGHRPLRVATTGWRSWEGATLAEWCVSSSGDCRLTTGRAPTMWRGWGGGCVKIVRREVATMGMWGNNGVRGIMGIIGLRIFLCLLLPGLPQAKVDYICLLLYLQKFTLQYCHFSWFSIIFHRFLLIHLRQNLFSFSNASFSYTCQIFLFQYLSLPRCETWPVGFVKIVTWISISPNILLGKNAFSWILSKLPAISPQLGELAQRRNSRFESQLRTKNTVWYSV